jgi:hypothetical protein
MLPEAKNDGGRQMSLWLDKEAADSLRALKDRYKPLSPTKIIGHLIKMAAKATS